MSDLSPDAVREALEKLPLAYPGAVPMGALDTVAEAARLWLESRSGPSDQEPLTAKQLEDVAWALDMLTKVSKVLLEPIAAMDEINAATMEIGVQVTRDGDPLTPADARLLLEWLEGDEMQQDLRRAALVAARQRVDSE